MGILDIIQDFNDRRRGILRTPYGTLQLSRDGKRVKKVALDFNLTTDALTRKDMADWRQAWQTAINVESPNRLRLYDIYRDAQVDAHLSGCVKQREGFVLARSFKLVNPKTGKEDEQALQCFEQGWFKQLCRLGLESIYWGHSLIELGELATDGYGCPCYSGVKLIPRKHVVPEYGRVVVNAGDDWRGGIDYRQQPFADWLIEVGQPDDLGLFLKAAPHTIPKKNMLAFWDAYGEIFGMPLRVAKTTTRDEKEKNKILQMLQKMGHNQSAVLDAETIIEFQETSHTDAYNIYNERVSRANSEISKLVIGQTMTIEDGSSLSQSQTHLEVFQNIVEADRDMLRDVVNNQLLPRMVKHGFPVRGLRFDWDYSVDYTPEQQVAYETMVADRYEVDPKYFAEKYSMPVGERRNQSMLPIIGDTSDKRDDDKKDDKVKQNNAKPSFFD